MKTTWLVRVGSLAALLGGFVWVVKGSAILITGVQPLSLKEIGRQPRGKGKPEGLVKQTAAQRRDYLSKYLALIPDLPV